MMLWSDIHYFDAKEFDSPDEVGSGFKMDLDFVRKLDALRQAVKRALIIHSGYRTPAHNRTVYGVDSSAHTEGHAVDIEIISARDRHTLVEAAFRLGFRRVGIGQTFIHLDDSLSHAQDVCWLYPTSDTRS